MIKQVAAKWTLLYVEVAFYQVTRCCVRLHGGLDLQVAFDWESTSEGLFLASR